MSKPSRLLALSILGSGASCWIGKRRVYIAGQLSPFPIILWKGTLHAVRGRKVVDSGLHPDPKGPFFYRATAEHHP